MLAAMEMMRRLQPKPRVIGICPSCVSEITELHCEPGERLPRLWGKPIHSNCFYGLTSMEGVQPPQRRPMNTSLHWTDSAAGFSSSDMSA